MPSTIGQVIINARQVVPDMPQTLPAPSAAVAVVTLPTTPISVVGATSNGTYIVWTMGAPFSGTVGQYITTASFANGLFNGGPWLVTQASFSQVVTLANGVANGQTAASGTMSIAPSSLPLGTYACVVTQRTLYGETSPSTEVTGLVVGVNQGIQVTSALQPSAVAIRAYLTLPGGAAGSEQQFVESTASPFTIVAAPPSAGVPPLNNRAFLPDTDGQLISCTAVYGWLNDGLRIISRIAGGLLDYSGVGSVSNVPMYTIPGEWNEITSIWYDGYWMMGGDRGYFWRRNNITSQILSSATISVINNQNVLEVYPQPARTASQTNLAVSMAATDTTATVVNVGGFLLPFGFMQIDQEIMGYQAINGPTQQFVNIIRGLGGSAAAAHTAPALVQELNIFWSGKRQIEPAYQPGQSATLIPLPSGWDVLLAQYISGRAKNIEHDGQYWQQLEQSIRQSIADWARQNKGVMRRRQVGPPSSPATFYNTPAGGLLIN
jgi:hypothetical protein